jgi:hypothetical protein
MIGDPTDDISLEQHAADVALTIEFLRGASAEHRRLADEIDRQAVHLALQLVELQAAMVRRAGRLQ